ncbi:diguanylate cyclase [Shinella sp. AETb1-6]|uniref:GGDEF domain-containing protein n=1 Tax=Shinella sp. AETb1-6 TaxID=2692210 RepID=UPI00136BC1A0|nr:diguanylate cyclase [Shinella sp. AETb1-6]MXN51796.1 diguanylate cyclase [Shinella sp. AETb1-6]
MNSKASTASKDTQQAVPPIAARIAQLMANLGIAALPRNYELLFEALNGNAGVAREIAALGKTPDQLSLDAIALRHALPSHNALAAGKAADDAVRVLCEIAKTAEESQRQRAVAVQELEEIAARMKRDPVLGISDFASDATRLLSLMQDILGTDRMASARIGDLQSHLDSLRSGLVTSREALTHDAVTGLANKAALLGHLKGIFEDKAAAGTCALLVFRVEQLREFAESHAAGADEKTVKRLATLFRQSVKKNDLVARTGPDLFCLLLSDVTREIATGIARRMADKVADMPFPFLDRELPAGFLTLTAGLSMTDSAKTPVMLCEQADQALAYASETGMALRIYSAEVAERAGRTYRGGAAA